MEDDDGSFYEGSMLEVVEDVSVGGDAEYETLLEDNLVAVVGNDLGDGEELEEGYIGKRVGEGTV